MLPWSCLAAAPLACSYPAHVFDLGVDAAGVPDVSVDSPMDAGEDLDAAVDSSVDVTSDAEGEVSSDAPEDQAQDVSEEGPADAPEDPAADGPMDALSDPIDAGIDGPEPCPGTHGPTMVRIGQFCIDSTEVTNAQYAQFLIAKGSDTSGQPAECAWNTSYELFAPYWPQAAANPVRSADWCDAAMFCQWAGKRLCGKIGGGPVPTASQLNAGIDQWYYACTGGAVTLWPYGDSYDPTLCHCKDLVDAGTVSAAGSLPGCQGGFPGVFDMSCNVWEWEDSCDGTTGADDMCTARGASWAHTGGQTMCTTRWEAKRNMAQADMGFRCCAP